MSNFQKMPLHWHLKELRWRVLTCIVFFALATAISYCYAKEIYDFLAQPLVNASNDDYSRRLIFTGLTEAFFTYLKLAIFAGLIISFPVFAYHLYKFLAPGLYRSEKMALLPYLVFSPTLFLAGAALVYYYVIPTAWAFFLSFESIGSGSDVKLILEARISEYLELITSLILGFGLAFQMPLILILLVQTQVLNAANLENKRRLSIVIIFVIAAILTPPDVISQIALAVPLILLYEISIVICKLIEKRRTLK